jgi:uncharacterized phage protein (TIGR01671 family)
MREIKFRAWDEVSKRLAEVTNVHPKCHDMAETVVVRDRSGESVNTLFSNYTLMQFTGLHDKNGKEIYEGDVVRACHKNEFKSFVCENGEIEWIEHLGQWGVRVPAMLSVESEDKQEKNDAMTWNMLKFNFKHGLELEVLGNIYENPELLT